MKTFKKINKILLLLFIVVMLLMGLVINGIIPNYKIFSLIFIGISALFFLSSTLLATYMLHINFESYGENYLKLFLARVSIIVLIVIAANLIMKGPKDIKPILIRVFVLTLISYYMESLKNKA